MSDAPDPVDPALQRVLDAIDTLRSEMRITRRIRAKRYNEQLKFFAGILNTLAVGLFGAAFILPVVAQSATGPDALMRPIWILAAIALHLMGLLTLGFLRSEE